ncbi:MAG TPA: fused MFS/spermidine synthase [Pyrinomonadaceae bacterium]|nr:fused MFS/spermidine synthase [Pyrinomonadaceae bacterium]
MYSKRTVLLIGACFVLSGATGLIYEVIWVRLLGLVFGATTLAISTVLAAFMGGLALGSAIAGRWGASIKRPFRAYGLLEIAIAVYAIAVPWLFSVVDNLYAFVWQQFQPGFFTFSVWRFVLSCIMLLVPTTLMGATLPILAAALKRSTTYKSASVTRLYTCNLVGAIGGTIAAGFFLLPHLGARNTIYFAALVNVIIGIVALLVDRDSTGVQAKEIVVELVAAKWEEVLGSNNRTFWYFVAFVSGFVTISTQVAWTRVLTMVIGSSTYAFSIVVALFLVGLSAGAYVIGRKDYSRRLLPAILRIEAATAAGLFLSLFIINQIPNLLVELGLNLNISSWPALLALQVAIAALLILLPAFLMGSVMPLVLVWASNRPTSDAVPLVGRSYAVNTVGAIVGAFSTGFLLIPLLTTRFTILFAAGLCLFTGGLAYRPRSATADLDLRRSLAVGVSVVLALGLFVISPQLRVADLSIGAYDSLVRVLARTREGVQEESNRTGSMTHQLLMYEEGPTATVSVRKDWGITSLAINGRTNASDSADMPTQVMLGQLPLLVAPSIKNSLVVGFASGVTVGSMLQSPIESVECLELEPATIQASRYFEHVNNRPLDDKRMRLIIDDARTYLRVTDSRYDVIVSEPSHPWVPGVANLFTQEFFELGRSRLTDQGVFAQWLQIYQLSNDSLRSVLATYKSVFPHVLVFRVGGATKGKDLILLGSMRPLSLNFIKERLSDGRISAELTRVEMSSEEQVRSWFVCDETALLPAVAGAQINTDDNMHIETTVPREAFLPMVQVNSDWLERLSK